MHNINLSIVIDVIISIVNSEVIWKLSWIVDSHHRKKQQQIDEVVVDNSEVIRTILTEEDFAYDEHYEEKNEISNNDSYIKTIII